MLLLATVIQSTYGLMSVGSKENS